MTGSVRRIGLGLAIVLAGLIGIGVVVRSVELVLDSRPSGPIGPFLQLAGPEAVTIRWRSESPMESGIAFRAVNASDWNRAGGDGAIRNHSVRLTDLQPDTEYLYRLGDESREYRFRTSPRPGDREPQRILILGDPGAANWTSLAIRDSARRWMTEHPIAGRGYAGPDIVLTTGDNAYPSGRDRDFRDGIFWIYAELFARTPLWPAHGNHDAQRASYRKIFELPTGGESGGVPSGSELYYSFQRGNLHVVVLDSERRRNLKPDSAMAEWLARDLATADADWLVAVVHRAPHSRGSNDSDAASGSDWRQRAVREDWMPVLEGHGVDLVIAGHSHGYERSRPVAGFFETSDRFDARFLASQAAGSAEDPYRRPRTCDRACGTVYLVAGMSALPQSGPLDHPMMAVSAADAGSVVLDIEGLRLTGRYLRTDGTIGDTFVIDKSD